MMQEAYQPWPKIPPEERERLAAAHRAMLEALVAPAPRPEEEDEAP